MKLTDNNKGEETLQVHYHSFAWREERSRKLILKNMLHYLEQEIVDALIKCIKRLKRNQILNTALTSLI